jgi:hypothetical protein
MSRYPHAVSSAKECELPRGLAFGAATGLTGAPLEAFIRVWLLVFGVAIPFLSTDAPFSRGSLNLSKRLLHQPINNDITTSFTRKVYKLLSEAPASLLFVLAAFK